MTDNLNKHFDKSAENSAVTAQTLICPLCNENNACCINVSQSCWCNDPKISFPEGLLAKLTTTQRGQACICQKCAVAYQKEI